MFLSTFKNINGKQFSKPEHDFHRPSAHNLLFQKKLNFLGCPYCSDKVGRKKNFKTLWTIYMHVQLNHKQEQENFSSVIWNLADFVIRGIIK